MNDKSLKSNKKLHNQDYVIPFVNRTSLSNLTWSFNLGNFKPIHIASKFFDVSLFLNALAIMSQLKL